jgi:hypothetical protein
MTRKTIQIDSALIARRDAENGQIGERSAPNQMK